MVGTSGQWPSGSMKKPCSGQQVSLAVHAAAAGVCVCVCVHSCFQGHYPSSRSNLPYDFFHHCTVAGGTAAVHLAVLTKLWCSVGRDTGRSILYLQFLIFTH